MISIIITAYNEEKYIERAIASALAQTHGDVEVIVINDGSTDNTRSLAENFLPDIALYNNETPTGLMAARNLGVSKASGGHITFLDGDDEFHIDKVAIQSEMVNRLPDKSMLFTGRVVFSETAVPRIPLPADISGRLITFGYNDVLQKRITSLGATFMMRRSDYNELGAMDKEVGKERDFIARFSFAGGGLYRLCMPLYMQHRKPNSMSTQKEKTYLREVKMMEAWRPADTRHADRNISADEFKAYEQSVVDSYKKQFAGSLVAPDVDDKFKAPFLVRLYNYLLQAQKNRIKDARGLNTYKKFKIVEPQLLAKRPEVEPRQC